jgi:predicted enzyme related to lactoylglutathione lyase
MTDAINWFEIPVRDLDRATRFYEAMLGKKLKRETMAGMPMATFPTGAMQDVGGSLVSDPKRAPSDQGALVYLDAPDLDDCISRASSAGGRIELPKTDIGGPGHIAIVVDTEGNRVGLHAHRS